MRDEKYVVFKRADMPAYMDDRALDDAVVIRTGDIYAPAVLWSYVHAATTTIELLEDVISRVGADSTALQLFDSLERQKKIRDYFAERAREADDRRGKLPD